MKLEQDTWDAITAFLAGISAFFLFLFILFFFFV